jgi:copper chaperone CopZ
VSTALTYGVTGMTCEHCVRAVTDELTALRGVRDVGIDLVVGGTSTVRVVSDAPLAESAVRDAVAEAGYTVVGTT